MYRPFEDEKKRAGGDFKKALPIRFEEGKHHPRYYFADQLVQIRDRQQFVERLVAGVYSDAVAFIAEASFVPAGGRVIGVVERANSAIIDVESFGRGFLVMSVTPHKYWRVTVDGQPVRSIVTNIGYQGVVVPSGRHRVVMRYRNDVVVIGGIISASALLLLMALAIFWRRRTA